MNHRVYAILEHKAYLMLFWRIVDSGIKTWI